MKIFTSFLLVFLFISNVNQIAAQEKKEPSLIFEDSGWLYSYEVHQVNLNDGEEKRSFSFEMDFMGFDAENSNLKFMVSQAMIGKYEHKEFEVKGFEDTIVNNVSFIGIWNAAAKKEFLKATLAYYNVKLEKKETERVFLEMYVEDLEKLKKYVSTSNSLNRSSELEKDKMIHENAKLKDIAALLKGDVIYTGDNSNGYNLEFFNNNFEANQTNFEKYGLAFKEINQTVVNYSIVKDN